MKTGKKNVLRGVILAWIATVAVIQPACFIDHDIDELEDEMNDAQDDTETSTDADTDTDTDSDTDTDADSDMDTDSDTDTDTDSDGDGDSDSGSDTDTDDLLPNGADCEQNNECKSDHCDHGICCDTRTCCRGGVESHCEPYACDVGIFQCVTTCGAENDDYRVLHQA